MTTEPKLMADPLQQRIHAASIAQEMLDSGLPSKFILQIFNLVAQDRQSAYHLMVIWHATADNPAERNDTIADMQELLDDMNLEAPKGKKPQLPSDDLSTLADRLAADKARLRDVIDRHGGVSRVAELSGIPQPSLSRMLNSASMPRRTTLYKLAKALELPEGDLLTDFSW